MKKLLVVMLVLGLTSVAGATNVDKLIQLTVDGQVYDEITLYESDWVTLDMQIADGHSSDGVELDLEVISLGGAGHIELDPEMVTVPTDILVAFEEWSHVVSGVSDSGIEVIAGMGFSPVTGKFVDYILFHCDGIGDVEVRITLSGTTRVDGDPITADDLGSIIIHQDIPEPMTVALLGLGSLFLLRRRK
jgi:hypothetical protein